MQYIGRIRSQSQGSSAIVDFLHVDDTPQAHWNNMVADAKQNCCALMNNDLVEREEDYLKHFSIVGVKQFVDMKGCRLVNAYRPFGGGEESCGRCDNCREGCAHTAASNRVHRNMMQTVNNRREAQKLMHRCYHVCIICKSSSCGGQNCSNRDECYCCGGKDHFSHQCTAKENKYTPPGFCYWCLGCKDDTGGVESHGGQPPNNICKMQKRLSRFFQYCFHAEHGYQNDNGSSYLEFMKKVFASKDSYYAAIVDLAKANNISCT